MTGIERATAKTRGEIPHTHRTGKPTPVVSGKTPGESYEHSHVIPETIYMHTVYQPDHN